MNDKNILLQTEGLSKYFKTPAGNLHAVDGIDLKIHEGGTLGVVGESGCGKSTLGRTVMRLLEPTSGCILFEGRDIAGAKGRELKALRKDMQIIFQDPYSSLDPRKTVFDTIAMPLKLNTPLRGKALDDKVFSLMETVGLAERFAFAYPHEMDGGRRQRIGVARALSLDPKFIVCDEPVSALDVSIQAQILNLLMDLQDEKGIAYMFITHDLSVVKHISDEIMIMYLGKCVEFATKESLFGSPRHPYTKALLSAILRPSLEARGQEGKLMSGEVSSPINPAPGCRFAPRCEFAEEACLREDIPLRQVADKHMVACIKEEAIQ
jgi:peptide/nickel transport system ATP-binding protein